MDEIAEYNRSLLAALIAFMEGDESVMAAHKLRFAIPVHPNQQIERLGLLKAVTARSDIPMHYRIKAKLELKSASISSWDDGDVPCTDHPT